MAAKTVPGMSVSSLAGYGSGSMSDDGMDVVCVADSAPMAALQECEVLAVRHLVVLPVASGIAVGSCRRRRPSCLG